MRRHIAQVASIAVVVAAAGIAWFVLSDRERKDPARPAGTVENPGGSAPAVAPESAVSPIRVDEPVRKAPADKAEIARARQQLRALGYVDETEGDEIEGTLIVADAAGVDHADRSGSFQAVIWSADSGLIGGTVRVDAGHFRVRVPAGEDLGVDDLELDGRAADTAERHFAVGPGHSIEVHAKWSRDVILHVVDAATHEELRELTVLRADDWFASEFAHPGSLGKEHLLIDHAASPITTQARGSDGATRWEPTLFAGAPGRAWRSVQVDYHVGGQVTLELPRGGDLEVTIVGEIPPLPELRSGRRDPDDSRILIRLRVAPPPPVAADVEMKVGERKRDHAGRHVISSDQIAESTPSTSGVTRFSGLAPGPLIVTLERGRFWRSSLVLARSPVSIVDGGLTRVALRVEARDDVGRRVPLSGTVCFSDEWHTNNLDLRFAPLKVEGASTVDDFRLALRDLVRIDGPHGLYRFDAGRVLPGRYLVTSYQFNYQQVVDTGTQGTDHAEIVIGDPADVVLHVVDADNGRSLDTPKLLWNCKRPAESTGGNFDHCQWDDSIRANRMRAPAGEVELRVSFEDGQAFEIVGSTILDVKPGENEATVRVRPLTCVELDFTQDGAEPTLLGRHASWLMTTLVATDDPGIVVETHNISAHSIYFTVPKPGRYSVNVPALDGFETVAPFEVEARKGECVVTTVALHSSQ